MTADLKRAVQTAKPAGLLKLSKEGAGNIYQYLSGVELVQMQVVGADTARNEWRYVQQEVKRRASQIPEVKEEERENVWRIYEYFRASKSHFKCFPALPPIPVDRYASLRGKSWIHELTAREVALLARDNLLPDVSDRRIAVAIPTLPKPPRDIWASVRGKRYIRQLNTEERQLLSSEGLFSEKLPRIPDEPVDIYASIRNKFQLEQLIAEEVQLLESHNLLQNFPELPFRPMDPWATLRTKRTMRELTLAEVHLLFKQGSLDRELEWFGRSDCEKAALIMETPFLRNRLSAEERTKSEGPSWLSRILGFFLIPILGLIPVSLGTILALCFAWLTAVPIFILMCGLLIAFSPLIILIEICSGDSVKCAEIKSLGKAALLALFLPLYPVFYLFVGFYLGGKYGLDYPWEKIKNLARFPVDLIFVGRPHHFSLTPYQTIANRALEASRVRKEENIYKFHIRAVPLPASESKATLLAENKGSALETPTTPLLSDSASSADYSSFS